MDLFKLVGSIFIDTDEANNSLSKTDKKADSLGDKFGSLAKGAAKVGTAVIGGATAVVSSVTAMASSTASEMDVIDKASQRMKIGAEAYQELAHAASLSGVEMSALEKAAKKLEGTDLNMDQALEEIYSLSTAEERATKAAELFGDSIAYQLTPMLNVTGEEFEAMRKEAQDLGLVFSEDTVAAGAALGDSLSKVQDSIGALATGLGASLMPIVQTFAEKLIDFMPVIQVMFDKLGPVLSDIFEQLMPPLFEIVDALLPVLSDLISELMPVFSQLVSAIMPILVSLLRMLAPILQPILQLLTPLVTLVITLLDPLLKLMNLILKPITAVIEVLANVMSERLSVAMNAATKIFNVWYTVVSNVFKGIITVVRGPVNTIIGFINGMVSGIAGGINTVINALNKLQIKVPDWVTKLTGVSSFGFNIPQVSAPQIPMLANGGDIASQGAAIVGEQGAELVQLNRGARVTPLKEGIEEKLDILTEAVREISENMAHLGLYINGGVMAGYLAPDIDQALGKIAARRV